MFHNSLEPFINKNMLVLNGKTSVRVAARALFERQVGCIIVSNDNGHIVGLVTDRDLTCLVLAFELPDTTPIERVMASELVTSENSTTLDQVIQLMEDYGVRRIPIIEKCKNGHEKCIGIVTLDDLLASEIVDKKKTAKIIQAQLSIDRVNSKEKLNVDAAEHVQNRFYKIMAHSMKLPRSLTEKISKVLLQRLVQRLPVQFAISFISQLPSKLQTNLYQMPVGPDMNVDEHVVLADLTTQFHLLHHQAVIVTKKFWQGLVKNVDPNVLQEVLHHLPSGLADLFSGPYNIEELEMAELFDLDS